MFRTANSERGATLVQVAIMILGLTTFSAFVIDYGVNWVSRRQAQNAADAGAMAGVIARLYDDTSINPPTGAGKVYDSIVNTVQLNKVWGVATPAPAIGITWTCLTDAGSNCVRVDVYRDGTNGSAPLPTFFLKLVGTTSQGTMATATARMAGADTAKCIKPWMVPDRFTNVVGNSGYQAGDIYIPPSQSNPTGYTRNEIGVRIELRLGDANVPSFYQRADLDASGDVGYRNAIPNCTTGDYKIGDVISSQNGKGSIPQQNNKMDELFAQDPNAFWDPIAKEVKGSCADDHSCSCGVCANGLAGKISPLIVYVPLINPADAVKSGKFDSPIVNILPFFISKNEYDSDGTIIGYIVRAPGLRTSGAGTVNPNNALIAMPLLIR